MSTYQSDITCPNCNKTAISQNDNGLVAIYCLHCGLEVVPKLTYLSLRELNEQRIDAKLKPLLRLPKQKYT